MGFSVQRMGGFGQKTAVSPFAARIMIQRGFSGFYRDVLPGIGAQCPLGIHLCRPRLNIAPRVEREVALGADNTANFLRFCPAIVTLAVARVVGGMTRLLGIQGDIAPGIQRGLACLPLIADIGCGQRNVALCL